MRLDVPPIAGLGMLAIAAVVLTAPTDAAGPATEIPISMSEHDRAIKGTVLEGAFTPAPDARTIVQESIFREGTRPVIARFSQGAGNSTLQDNNSDEGATRAGLGMKIKAANGDDFDIVASQHRDPIAGTYPVSYAQAKYFGINPVKFINDKGLPVYVRYQFVPRAQERYLTANEHKAQGVAYLHNEIVKRIAMTPVMFDWYAQIAAEGDVIGDPLVVWPDRSEVVKLGTFTLTGTLAEVPGGP